MAHPFYGPRNGGQAFPSTAIVSTTPGMTLLDWFAQGADLGGYDFHDTEEIARIVGMDLPDEIDTQAMLDLSFRIQAYLRYRTAAAMLAERARLAGTPPDDAEADDEASRAAGELALEALRLHVAYQSLPPDEGGPKLGPKGRAWAAFAEARNAALYSVRPGPTPSAHPGLDPGSRSDTTGGSDA